MLTIAVTLLEGVQILLTLVMKYLNVGSSLLTFILLYIIADALKWKL